MFRTFGDAKSYDVRIALYDGGLKELQQMVGRGQYAWDAVDLELPDAITACRQGLLEHVDAAQLPAGADGTPAAKDFVKNAIGSCWVGSVVYSQVMVFSQRRFSGSNVPKTAADFSTCSASLARAPCAVAPSSISSLRCSPTA